MDSASKSGLMVHSRRENGKRIIAMAKESLYGQMAPIRRVISTRTANKATVSSFGLKANIIMRAAGSKI